MVYSSDSHLAETNSQGLFAYDNLEEGTYEFQVSSAAGGTYAVTREVRFKSPGESLVIALNPDQ